MIQHHVPGLIPARAGKTGAPLIGRHLLGAHPRACGENGTTRPCPFGGPGSSPRVRGKLGVGEAHGGVDGLIPARAGKTRVPFVWVLICAAHPRVCGENAGRCRAVGLSAGSSPRVRGKRVLGHSGFSVGRLIPACAGKTPVISPKPFSRTAHPRVCGENPGVAHRFRCLPGSSPRVRGKRRMVRPRRRRTRLIPACAGKTPAHVDMSSPFPAHPRVCGENGGRYLRQFIPTGSSPRVRGKRAGEDRAGALDGLIPACAGKTVLISYCPRPDAAHPRVCGENWGRGCGRGRRPGSSPRVRGKLLIGYSITQQHRLIPACAGKTFSPVCVYSSPTAHPRVCGENGVGAGVGAHPHGSSPRVRGKLKSSHGKFS